MSIRYMSSKEKYKCQFCEKDFSNKYSLSKHQKCASYCVAIQKVVGSAAKLEPQGVSSNKYKCQFCAKDFSNKYSLSKHQKNASYCVALQKVQDTIIAKKASEGNKLQEELVGLRILLDQKNVMLEQKDVMLEQKDVMLEQKDEVIKKLEARLEKHEETIADIARQPTTKIENTTNILQPTKIENTMNILSPITAEHLRDQAQFLQMEHIQEGIDGYARYALDYPLKNRVVCTDFSRRKIQYKNGEGKVVSDPAMRKLSHELFKAIRERNDELFTDYMTKLIEAVRNDPSQANQQILTDVCELRAEVKRLADGRKSEMTPLFVKSVCAGTTNSESMEIK